MALFCGHLEQGGYAPSTIASSISAIGFVHKLLGVQNPCTSFFVESLVKATRKRQEPDDRDPISLRLLERLIGAMVSRWGMSYEFLLYRCLFCTAFFGFCRIGELVSSSGLSDHKLLSSNIVCEDQQVLVTFRTFKHSRKSEQIAMRAIESVACPVRAMREYLRSRPSRDGRDALFIGRSAQPLSRSGLVNILKQLCVDVGAHGRFDGHSFRIGATCHAAAQGKTSVQIMKLGRWHSDAFKKYLRTPLSL